uniref:AB hydrolase-1 domain-containing protein n=1 Tax=Oryzias sinensis TaxID=183150 RepID=A0A8C7YVK1_9TELE
MWDFQRRLCRRSRFQWTSCSLLRVPFFVDLSRPQDVLNHTCASENAACLFGAGGSWRTGAASEALADGQPVIIYLHGNVGTSVFLWDPQLLSAAGFHVLSLDYRGFGDSSGHPSEAGLTSDALYLQQWVKTRSGGSPVCLWGHSLGSGSDCAVDALILEAPTHIHAVPFRFSQIYTFLPGFKDFLFDLLEKNQIEFANDKNLKTLTCPLLILHAEDDNVVPHQFGADDRVAMVSYPSAATVGVRGRGSNVPFPHFAQKPVKVRIRLQSFYFSRYFLDTAFRL